MSCCLDDVASTVRARVRLPLPLPLLLQAAAGRGGVQVGTACAGAADTAAPGSRLEHTMPQMPVLRLLVNCWATTDGGERPRPRL